MTLPASVVYVVIHFATNNVGHSSPLEIAEGLINMDCMLKKNHKTFIFLLAIFYKDMMKNQSIHHYYTPLTPTNKNFAVMNSIILS